MCWRTIMIQRSMEITSSRSSFLKRGAPPTVEVSCARIICGFTFRAGIYRAAVRLRFAILLTQVISTQGGCFLGGGLPLSSSKTALLCGRSHTAPIYFLVIIEQLLMSACPSEMYPAALIH